MKSEGEKMNKRRKEREEKERHDKPGRRKRRRRREWGSGPLIMILYRLLSHLYVFPINLVRNPLPVNVSIIDRTTSNMVFIVVFSLPLVYVSSDLATQLGLHCAELRR